MARPPDSYLTLVVIVRDEAASLERLLAWHRPLYDRAVVVDTGSLDTSRAVAADAGAQVVDFVWCGDFSAARNAGLAEVDQGWVLVLDCDELLSPDNFSAVRGFCGDSAQGWVFHQWNYCGRRDDPLWCPLPPGLPLAPFGVAGYVTALTCRLFPACPQVRYTGVVHELPDQSLQRAGMPLGDTGLPIHHYGHLIGPELSEKKNHLYRQLLRAKLNKSPQDPKVRYEMAVQLAAEGQAALAVRLLQRTVREDPHHPETLRARLLWGRLLLADGQAGPAVAAIEEAVRLWPAQRESWMAAGQVHAALGQTARAALYLQQGRALFPADPALKGLQSQVLQGLDDIGQANA